MVKEIPPNERLHFLFPPLSPKQQLLLSTDFGKEHKPWLHLMKEGKASISITMRICYFPTVEQAFLLRFFQFQHWLP